MKTRDKDVKASAELERVRSAFKKFRADGNGRGSGYPSEAFGSCGRELRPYAH
jgi:hypothetical protein